MLHHHGGVLVNKNPGPFSIALFPDDLVETQAGYEATLDAPGSTATIKSETVVQFQGNELDLEHGVLLVSTSHGMKVRVGCLTVIPVNTDWTQYDVADVNGKITVAAHKSDVQVESTAVTEKMKKTDHPANVSVREGEQHDFDEKCAPAAKPPTYVAAKGAIMNSPFVKWPSVVGIGVLTCWAL